MSKKEAAFFPFSPTNVELFLDFDGAAKCDDQLLAVKSYQSVFKDFTEPLTKSNVNDTNKTNVGNFLSDPFLVRGWETALEMLMAQKESPPAFFLSNKFYAHAYQMIKKTVEKLDNDNFQEFFEINATCPYPVTLFYLPRSNIPILGIRNDFSSYYLWQSFLKGEKGGMVFFHDIKANEIFSCTVNEHAMSDMSRNIWTEKLEVLNDQYLEVYFHQALYTVSLSNAAIKSPATDCLPVNSSNKVTKIKDRKDEHKLYRVRLSDNKGSRRAPMFYVPRKEHDVKGHTRTYKKSGKTIYIKNHKRGDASLGVITKDYLLDD